MKIKQTSSDFIVEEILDFNLKSDGEYKLYSLTKNNLETLELISYLSQKNNIPKSDFFIAGIKDKIGITKQYLTILKKYEFKELKGENYFLDFLGFVENPIKIGDLNKNKFTIIVRDLDNSQIENLELKIKNLINFGVLNYFDSQRFGSIVEGEFIGKLVIQKDFQRAVMLFLYSQYIRLKLKNYLSKEDFFSLISNFEKDLDYPYYKSMRNKFLENGGSWKLTYKTIPVKQRELFIMAYQSYLWNECVGELLRNNFEKNQIKKVKYIAGELFFYRNQSISEKNFEKLPLSFSMIGRKFDFENFEEKIISKLLKNENITHIQIKALSKTGTFLKTEKRALLIKPYNFKFLEVSKDEMSRNNKKKVKISFGLQKGSYATIILKSLF